MNCIPLPHMPILESLSSVTNVNMMSKIMEKWSTIIRLSSKHCGKRRKFAHYEQFLLFPQCFQKISGFDASK